MRHSVKDFVSLAAACLPMQEPIYEFGSLQVAGQEGFANLRSLFPGKDYVGCDIRKGLGVDRILDLHSIDLPSESIGTVLCLDTLEHVEYPREAISSIERILKPGGVAVISSVTYFPVHDHPNDYWRFTPEAFTSILKPFRNSFVGHAGNQFFPDPVVGIGFKGENPSLTRFQMEFKRWQRKHNLSLEHIVAMTAPPKLLPGLFRLHARLALLTGRMR